jgi:hypothetical protein
MLIALWLCVVAYIAVQGIVLARSNRRSWMVAATPMLYMVPIFVITVQALAEESNVWPLLMLLASPVALVHAGIIAIVQRSLSAGSRRAA